MLRASAYQKAALAPALLETAGKSERFAYEKLGAEQRERVGIQKVRLVPTLTLTVTLTLTLTLALALTLTLTLALALTLTRPKERGSATRKTEDLSVVRTGCV